MQSNGTPNSTRDGRWPHRDFTPMTPVPVNSGLNPRYVPPQRRDGFDSDLPIRPESSMSNQSFASQIPFSDGGVSINGYGNASNYATVNGIPYLGTSNIFSGRVPLPNQMPYSPANRDHGTRPAFGGRVNTYNGLTTNNSSSDSAATDSAHTLGANRASNIAAMIVHGYADGPDDPAFDAPGSAVRGRKTARGANNLPLPQRTARPDYHALVGSTAANHQSNALANAKDGNTKGNAAAYLGVEISVPPEWLNRAHQTGSRPTIEQVFNDLPLMEACRYAAPSTGGVVRVRNIPYATPRNELIALVGRNAQIVSQPEGSPYHAVHIIMERHTGKTMDAFIEFVRPSEASTVVYQIQRRISQGRQPKVGDRQVEVELSSQEELMSELFPRTKDVVWEGANPRVLVSQAMYYQDTPAAGFTGFLQKEEVVMMVKHAETPQRSPFAQRCLVRTYESLISTLHKYPWFAHANVTMDERRELFKATLDITRALVNFLRRTGAQQLDQSKPTFATLQELTVAALTCPGFSEQQKATIVLCLQHGSFGHMTSSRGMNLRFGGVSPLSSNWPFKVLAKAPSASDHVVNYLASLLREATGSSTTASLTDLHAQRASAMVPSAFGILNINYGSANTIAQVGRVELNYVEDMLRRVLPRSH